MSAAGSGSGPPMVLWCYTTCLIPMLLLENELLKECVKMENDKYEISKFDLFVGTDGITASFGNG